FVAGGRRYCPVDNEPVAFLYDRALSGQEPPGHLGAALRDGVLPISWQLDVPWEGAGKVRTGGVATPFREHGVLLAHLLDAAPGVPGDDARPCSQRSWRPLHLANLFPWPGIRRTEQEVIEAPAGLEQTQKDLSGECWVRRILLGYVAEKLAGTEV